MCVHSNTAHVLWQLLAHNYKDIFYVILHDVTHARMRTHMCAAAVTAIEETSKMLLMNKYLSISGFKFLL
jgi:hypothetical protein